MGNDIYSNLIAITAGGTAARKFNSKFADIISVADFGAVGNGVTDDSSAINAASLALSQAGGGVLVFDSAKTYYITTTLLIYPNVSFDGRGCTIVTDRAIWFMGNPGPTSNGLTPTVSATVTANPSAGTNAVTVNSVSGFNIGDLVDVRLGDNPVDLPEPRYVLINARIAGIDPVNNILSFDQSIPYAIDLSGAGAGNKVVWKFAYVLRDTWIKNFNFECSGTPNIQGGILLAYASDILIENIQGNKNGGVNMGAGIVVLFQCERISIRQIKLYRNAGTSGQASVGRCFNFSNCYDVTVQDVEASNIRRSLCFNESFCERLVFENVIVRSENNTGTDPLFNTSAGSIDVLYRNVAVEYPVAGTILDDQGDPNHPAFNVRFENLTWRGGFPTIAGGVTTLKGILDYNDGTNAFTVDLDDVTDGVLTVPLTPGMTAVSFPLQPGFLLPDIDVYVPPFVDTSHITGFFLGSDPHLGSLSAGNQKRFTYRKTFGTNATPYGAIANILNPQANVIFYTDSSSAGYVILRYKVARYISSSGGGLDSIAMTEAVALRARNAPYFALVNAGPATIANQTTFTVPGGYSPGRILVFANGALRTDVTATNGSTIVFATGLAIGATVYVAVIV